MADRREELVLRGVRRPCHFRLTLRPLPGPLGPKPRFIESEALGLIRGVLAAAASGESALAPLDEGLVAGTKGMLLNARGFQLEDGKPWILVGLKVADAAEALRPPAA